MSKHWTYYVAKSWQKFVEVFLWVMFAASVVTFIWMQVWICIEIPGGLFFWGSVGISVAIATIVHFIKKLHKWTEKVLEDQRKKEGKKK